MVLTPKRRKSRSPPGLPKTETVNSQKIRKNPFIPSDAADKVAPKHPGAGWSSPVARQAHNLKVVGSNPTPATIIHRIRSRA